LFGLLSLNVFEVAHQEIIDGASVLIYLDLIPFILSIPNVIHEIFTWGNKEGSGSIDDWRVVFFFFCWVVFTWHILTLAIAYNGGMVLLPQVIVKGIDVEDVNYHLTHILTKTVEIILLKIVLSFNWIL
jgi:hypothetical protein